jgi:ATP-dependent DNA helicase RecG
MIKSEINTMLTLDYMINEQENKYFDRKSAKIKPSSLADLISAFANAEGGTIVIGISDKKKTLEGINDIGNDKINTLINVSKDCCNPTPSCKEEFIDIKNVNGLADRLLLLHVLRSVNQVIRTSNDSIFLRIGDRTKELKGDDLRNLEYSKFSIHFEDECNFDAAISDLDEELIEKYKRKIGAENISTKQLLKARGMIKIINGEERLTNATVLLFAKNIIQFYPNCRVRFLRYDGILEKVGTNINIVKDVNVEYPILKIIEKAKEFIATQLRDFTVLNQKNAKFEMIPEYPEFAWVEGLINAIIHREYALTGNFIKVSMFDDRLEILSPGELPNIVTLENMKETRFSRNPKMARVLTEFGYVRELNEGVNRIYLEMKRSLQEDPIYTEVGHCVKLVLKNNISVRNEDDFDTISNFIDDTIWNELGDLDRKILNYINNNNEAKTGDIAKYLLVTKSGVQKRLLKLQNKKLVLRNGNSNSPNVSYSLMINNRK